MMERRPSFRLRLWLAFLVLLALVGVGSLVLAAASWTGLESLGVGFAMLAVAGFAVSFMVQRLAQPLEELTDATRRFGEGELSYRVPIIEPVRRRVMEHRARRLRMPRRRQRKGFDELFMLGVAWNEMAERVEKLVRGQRELLANVSHELRSPLARVRVALELVPQTPENEKRLADIALDLSELERLIDDVLTTSRLDARGLPTRLEQVDVAALFESLVERAKHDPITAGKEVKVRMSPAVKSIMADPALLRRALWNLIENAGKYGAAPITLVAIPIEKGVCLSVEDAGPGVPAELQKSLFDPFVRAAKDRSVAGFGLGLTIAKSIAEVHGGTIALATTLAGTRIDITIPSL